MTDERPVNWGAGQLASERTLLAAERTFSAWIRTGLTAIGGGLPVARVLVFKSHAHELLAHAIGGLLLVWGASVFNPRNPELPSHLQKTVTRGPLQKRTGRDESDDRNPAGHRRAGVVGRAFMNDYRARTRYRQESSS